MSKQKIETPSDSTLESVTYPYWKTLDLETPIKLPAGSIEVIMSLSEVLVYRVIRWEKVKTTNWAGEPIEEWIAVERELVASSKLIDTEEKIRQGMLSLFSAIKEN